MHKLTIEDDEGKTVVVPLIREEITVGRQEGNSIRLTERNISRRHARFYRQTGILYVEDLGSYNGIKVNGTRITEATPLKDGDLVLVGDYKLTVRADKPVQTRLYAGGAPFSTAPGPGASAPGAATSTSTSATMVGNATASPAGAAATAGSAAAPSVTPLRPNVNVGTTAPAPDASLDAAPTIPVRTLAEQGLTGSDAPPARLVVVSTNLAGSEFTLDRASLVIGRTPENDIVLNHKSISRHHAKIIRDGDKYIVVDLESANGVRVNGSEFERVELQTGDTVELGHVRLKFAGGNEYIDFDASSAVGGKRRLMIVGAVGAVALTGIVLALSAGDDKAARPPETATATPATTGESPTPAASSAALDPLLADARSAIEREDWTAASDAVKKALQLVPTSADAASLRETIDAEQAASDRFNRIKQAADQKKHEEVLALFPTIPERSVYRPRALPLKEAAEKRLIDQSLTDAEKAQGKNQCEAALQAIERVTALDPDNTRARTIREKCDKEATRIAERQAKQAEQEALRERQRQEKEAKEQAKEQERLAAKEAAAAKTAAREAAKEKSAVAVQDVRPPRSSASTALADRGDRDRPERNERPIIAKATDNPPPVRAPRTPPRVAAPPPPAPAAAPEPTPAGDPDALLQEATLAWQRGQYAAAIETSRRALKIRPSATQAYRIIAVCSCSLRDADSATRAYERVEDRFKSLVKSACQRNGISLP